LTRWFRKAKQLYIDKMLYKTLPKLYMKSLLDV